MISKQLAYDNSYMGITRIVADLSHDRKIQVGCIIVREGQILSQGWNGTPSGMSNSTRTDAGVTYPWVIHAESNAIAKLAKNGGSANGATLYSTHSPCYTCASLVLQCGITRIVYDNAYDLKAIKYLKERGLKVEQIESSSRVPDREGKES